MSDKKWDLFALASIPLVMTLGNSMLIPVLPTIEKKIDISSFQSSMIITVYSVVAILLIPIAGYLSDRLGRKNVIVPSLIIAGIGGAVSTFAAWKLDNPYWLLLAGRFLQGIGASGAFPVVLPTVGDLFKDEAQVSKGLGVIETANTFGKVLSPILGSLLAFWFWFAPFASIPAFSIIAIILVIFLIKTPKNENHIKTEDFHTFLGHVKQIFRQEGRWLFAIFFIGCINMLVLFGFLFNISSVLESKYKIDGILKGAVLAIPLLMLCVASYVTGKKIGRNKGLMKWIIFVGNLVAAAPLFFMQKDLNIYIMLTVLTISGIGIGVSLPCLDALITEGIDKQERGTITSFYSSMRFIGVAAGPPLVALLDKWQPQLIYIALASLSIVAAFVTFFAIKPSEEKNPGGGLATQTSGFEAAPSLFTSHKSK
ncbi:MFS transporter [Bacillus sp. HMF5848]|uniref:MFS transporter n=1 Tax=Bacillus sp. HMF5848 TaxID=2495421 RepID=UPI000F7A635C|nr:MFS transporter [Bacillus sp. HMF5848]RSK27347.1 MFS transporter [Bacillus sp. HMF5848]